MGYLDIEWKVFEIQVCCELKNDNFLGDGADVSKQVPYTWKSPRFTTFSKDITFHYF